MAGLLHHRNKSFIGPHSLDVLSIKVPPSSNSVGPLKYTSLLISSLICFIILINVLFQNIVYCEGTDLVLWGQPGTLGNTLGVRWTAVERAYWVIDNVPPYILQSTQGLLLSDASIELPRGIVNARLQFFQSTGHFEYFSFVFFIFLILYSRKY